MKYIFLSLSKIIVISLFIAIAMGCSQKDHDTGKPVITVSILPQKYFVEKIAGDKFDVNVMIPPGASHENYDPTPEQLISLSKTAVYFRNGYLDFENFWIEKFVNNNPDLKFINLSKNLSLINNLDDHHGAIDPHTWMSPLNVKSMATKIYETLVTMDRKNENYYTLNYRLFLNELDSLHTAILKQFDGLKTNSFIIYHPALTYYARDYGLKQYALEMDGKNPSAFHIRALIDIARKENIRTILVQKQYDQSKAETLAKETGASVIEIDPLSENWSSELMNITLKLSESFNKTPE